MECGGELREAPLWREISVPAQRMRGIVSAEPSYVSGGLIGA